MTTGPRRSLRQRATLTRYASSSSPEAMSRPRRAAAAGATGASPTVTVSRSPSNTPEESRRSIRLTVKMPSSKLRQVENSDQKSISINPRETLQPGEIVSGPRSSRNKKKIVESESEEEEEEEEEEAEDFDEEEEEDDDDEDGDDDEEEEDEDEESESPDADEDADGDVEMEDEEPPPPIIKKQPGASRPSLIVTPAVNGPVKSVEAKEMEMADDDDDDDDELSELESQVEDESQMLDNGQPEEDIELDEEGEEEEEDDDDEDADSDGTPAIGSRASTPDLSKMTKRQRGRLEQMGGDFLQLPMEPQIKKHLTAEEHAMRRAEMARRRKNLSEKRNEEEKMDTINKLLKKQAPKRRGKISATETAGDATPYLQEEMERPKAGYVRWVSHRKGRKIGVPIEWFGTPVGKVFGEPRNKRMIEEVEG